MLRLFHSHDRCARAVHIALEEGEYEAVRKSLSDGDQRQPDYLAINPKGRVPTLITDQAVLTETRAILTYIAQLYPDSPLGLPADPLHHAQIQSLNLYLCSTLHVAHAHKQRGTRWADVPAAIAEMRRNSPNRSAPVSRFRNGAVPGPMGDGRDLHGLRSILVCLFRVDGRRRRRSRALLETTRSPVAHGRASRRGPGQCRPWCGVALLVRPPAPRFPRPARRW
jgi:hypothetical protein